MAFIDYKKAFDSVKHRNLWKTLKEFGLCTTVVDVLETLYMVQRASVRMESELTDWFEIKKGVRQGCLISPMSFNCYSERVLRESADELKDIGIKGSGRVINNLRYADDIVLIATSPDDLQKLIDEVDEVSRKFGLEISTRKTCLLYTSPSPRD